MEHNHTDNTLSNALLFILAFAFKIIGSMTVSSFLSLILTCLSIISVTMIIVINWNKFYDKIKNWKK